MILEGVLQGWAACVGLAVGSFLNVVIARLPEDRSVVHPPSHCPVCGSAIAWYDNVPVLSWVLLRARCRSCSTPISPLYPTVELLFGALALLLWRHMIHGLPQPLEMAAWAVKLVFVAMMVSGALIDVRHKIIPDELTIYALPFGILANGLLHHFGYAAAPSWQEAALGATVGGGFLLTVAGVAWLIYRREAMGMGDVKMLGMIGAWVGLYPDLVIVSVVGPMIGAVVGILILLSGKGGGRFAVPFGPFLAMGALAQVYFGEDIVRWWHGG